MDELYTNPTEITSGCGPGACLYWRNQDRGKRQYLKDLVVLASSEAKFTKENSQIVYNADSNNFFVLGAGTDPAMPANDL